MIPAHLLDSPPLPPSRFTPAQRAKALAQLTPMGSHWRPRLDARTETQTIGSILLALKYRVPQEIKEVKAEIRALGRRSGAHRAKLAKLQKADTINGG
jgi:hypothetical protein